MVRKLLGMAVVAVCVVVLMVVGCGRRQAPPASGPQPFTLDYAVGDANRSFFADGDTFAMLAASSPFYPGAYSLPGQRTSDFDSRREAKVAEIVEISAETARLSRSVLPALHAAREAYLAFLSVCLRREPALKDFAASAVAQLSAREFRIALASQSAEAIAVPASPLLARSEMQYQKVMREVRLAALCLESASVIPGLAARTANAAESLSDPAVQAAAAKLDEAMESFDASRKTFDDIAVGTQRIFLGLKQLRTADYHFALAGIDFFEQTLPAVRDRLGSLKTARPREAADMAAALSEYESTLLQSKRIMQKVDKSLLLPLPQAQRSLIPAAYAYKDGGNYEMGYNSLGEALHKADFSDSRQFTSAAWQGIRRSPSAAVEMTELALKTGKNVMSGLVDGRTQQQIDAESRRLWNESEARFKANTQGSAILTNARDMMDIAEETAEDLGSGAARGILGGGTAAPFIAGKIAKAVVGMFTGLGKGIYSLTDPQASAGELAQGAIDVGFSLIGGSKCLARPSLVTNWAKGTGTQAVKQTLETTARESAEAAVVAGNRTLFEAAKELTGAFASQAGKTAGDNLNDVAVKTFAANLSGLKQALKTAIGERGASFVDNVVGEWVDNTIQDKVGKLIDGEDKQQNADPLSSQAGVRGAVSGSAGVTSGVRGSEWASSGLVGTGKGASRQGRLHPGKRDATKGTHNIGKAGGGGQKGDHLSGKPGKGSKQANAGKRNKTKSGKGQKAGKRGGSHTITFTPM